MSLSLKSLWVPYGPILPPIVDVNPYIKKKRYLDKKQSKYWGMIV